jgi:hypothetical protein
MGNVVRRLFLVALLAGLVAGCSDDKKSAVTTRTATTTATSSKPTGAERTWVESVGEWSQTFGGELQANAIADCPGSLREQAGPRPTARLAGLEDLALALCRSYRRLAHAGRGGRAEALATANRLENALNTQVYGFEFIAGPGRPLQVKGGMTDESRIEPRLSRVLSQLTEIKKSEARCWSDADWKVVATHSAYGPRELGGFVDSAAAVQLNPVICRALVRYLYGHAKPTDPGITEAVVVFSHESEHAGGEDREDRAECWGMQRARRAAQLFGMSAQAAEALVQRYWNTVYQQETPPYFSPQCRDGGEFDLRPKIHVFP